MVRRAVVWALGSLVTLWGLGVGADEVAAQGRLRLDGGVSFHRFEQQVKVEVGGARGERLVEEMELASGVSATWRVIEPLEVGLYGRFDAGVRRAGRFAGFDAEGRTVVAGALGGTYGELWLGPLVRGSWRTLFVEVGYGALGLRQDEARTDLATAAGETDGALSTSPTVAWLFAAGGGVPLTPSLQLVLKMEFRVRYYVERGGEALANDIVHGTQNWTPLVGVAWTTW